MTTGSLKTARRVRAGLAVIALLTLTLDARAADPIPAPTQTGARPAAAAATNPSPASATFKPEQIEADCAQIALYPDSLLAQVLMASTYPLEVVQAERWGKENGQLKGDAL